MIQDGRGDVTITNGATILRQTQALHPTARMPVELRLKRKKEMAPQQWSSLLALSLIPVPGFFRNGFIISRSL